MGAESAHALTVAWYLTRGLFGHEPPMLPMEVSFTYSPVLRPSRVREMQVVGEALTWVGVSARPPSCTGTPTLRRPVRTGGGHCHRSPISRQLPASQQRSE